MSATEPVRPQPLGYTATVTVLTPLHLGSGRILAADVDYRVHDRTLLVVRPERLLDGLSSDSLAGMGDYRLSTLGTAAEMSSLASYQLPLPPGSRAPGRIRQHVRDPEDQPYLPGSVLKGALRTALLWSLAEQRGTAWLDEQVQRLIASGADRPRPGQAAPAIPWQPGRMVERMLLGSSAYQDVLRALRVDDCALADRERGTARLLETMCWGGRGRQAPAEVGWAECLPPQAMFSGSWSYDLGRWRAAQGGDPQEMAPLSAPDLLDACQRFATALLTAEQEHWQRHLAARSVVAIYEALQAHQAHAARDEYSALLWLGWGTGWRGTTVASLLPDETAAQVVRPERSLSGNTGSERPTGVSASRRVILAGGRPAGPLGWVRLTLTPRPQGERGAWPPSASQSVEPTDR